MWISIEDEFPKEGVYLFATKKKHVAIGFLSGYSARYKKPVVEINSRGVEFTHWQPLPEPPKD